MIVDSSAVVAMIFSEPERPHFRALIAAAPGSRMSAASLLESAIVVDGRRDPALSGQFDQLLTELAMVIEPVTVAQARIARQAYRDFGRGSGHPAGLNFGDCFAYALAKDTGEALLYKGDDFVHTDVRSAPAAARPSQADPG